MSRAGSMSPYEIKLADRLISGGIERPQAVLAVAMYTRGHSRPEREIVDLVRQYPGLSTPGVAEAAFSALRRRGWIVEQEVTGTIILCSATPDFPEKAADFLKDPTFTKALKEQRRSNQPSVQLLGHMHDVGVYESFGPTIRTATHEIMLPMINTTPNLTQVADLRAVAESGVTVRILLASPKLAAKLRGNTSLIEARRRLDGWMLHSKGIENFYIRVTSHASDLWLASSMCIDNRLVRLDIFDPQSQRTTQGVMVEAISDGSSNLALLFQASFENGWRRSYTPTATGALAAFIRRAWLPTIIGASFALTLVLTPGNSAAVAFTGGIVTGLISNYLPRIPDALGNLVERVRR